MGNPALSTGASMLDLLFAGLKAVPALATALVVTLSTAVHGAGDHSGYDRLDVKAAHRSGLVSASVWYPDSGGGNPGLIGDNAVIAGTPARVGATLADGQFPLVLLSHGSGGNMDGHAWLSSELAARGIMVLAVNHPGSTSGDSSARRSVDLASRAADLTAALDTLLGDPNFGPHVDRSRIVAVGFSLGGATALNLGGLVADRSAFAAYCARIAGPHDCGWFKAGGVDPATLPESFSATRADPRVTAVAAVDPAFGDTFTPESIAAFGKPALFINLGEADRWRAVDVGPSGNDLAGRLPGARLDVIAPAWHFSFLGICKAEGRDILIREKDDPICDDPSGSDRADVHRRAIDTIAAFVNGR